MTAREGKQSTPSGQRLLSSNDSSLARQQHRTGAEGISANAIRRVARVVAGAAGQIAELCTACDYSRPGKPQIDWDDPQAKDALVSALVNDANALLSVLDDR